MKVISRIFEGDPLLGYTAGNNAASRVDVHTTVPVYFIDYARQSLHSHMPLPKCLQNLNEADYKYVYAYMRSANAHEFNRYTGKELKKLNVKQTIERKLKKRYLEERSFAANVDQKKSHDDDIGEVLLWRSKYLLERDITNNKFIRTEILNKVIGKNLPKLPEALKIQQDDFEQKIYIDIFKLLGQSQSPTVIAFIARMRGLDPTTICNLLNVKEGSSFVINPDSLLPRLRKAADQAIFDFFANRVIDIIQTKIAPTRDSNEQRFLQYLISMDPSPGKFFSLLKSCGLEEKAIAKLFSYDEDFVNKEMNQANRVFLENKTAKLPSRLIPFVQKLNVKQKTVLELYFAGKSLTDEAVTRLRLYNDLAAANHALHDAFKLVELSKDEDIELIRDRYLLATADKDPSIFQDRLLEYMIDRATSPTTPVGLDPQRYLTAFKQALATKFDEVVAGQKNGKDYKRPMIAAIIGVSRKNALAIYRGDKATLGNTLRLIKIALNKNESMSSLKKLALDFYAGERPTATEDLDDEAEDTPFEIQLTRIAQRGISLPGYQTMISHLEPDEHKRAMQIYYEYTRE
ncbi:MAG: hypothetical protein O3C63_09170 [Cyanobacteria bacterium]|nr:hypothetical protein [Cyanobacteriota bacterium]